MKTSFNLKKVIVVFVLLLLPTSVSAGLVEALSNILFKNSEGKNAVSIKNVQNMALLAAASSPISNDEKTHVPVVENDALVSESGLSGGVSGSLSSKPTSDQISIYVVREGDTLSQIAEMYNVTVNTIKWGNDLSSNTVKPGDTLIILPISGVKHIVAKGDTLASVAKKYNGDIDEIIAYNNLSKNESLVVGSEIIVPDGEVLSSSSSYASTGSAGLREYSGYYVRPTSGRRSQGLHGHNAIDIAAPVGTPIFASAEGEVIIARTGGWNGGYGNYVVVKHPNGTQTLYAHTSKNAVSVGDSVDQGEIIGYVGVTGKVTGAHLHFEIRGGKNPF